MNPESVSTRRPYSKRQFIRRTLWGLGLVACLLTGFLHYIGLFSGNVRVVEAHQVYRSAQLTGSQLREVLRSNGIRSVINLRGRLPQDAKLRDERAVCKEMNILHVDVSMSATALPQPAEVQKLLRALDTLPRPVLIHCAGGSDRTGLACTLYRVIERHAPLDQAQTDQLTWRYGHFAFGTAHPMDDFFQLYRESSHGMSMRSWVLHRYPVIYTRIQRAQHH